MLINLTDSPVLPGPSFSSGDQSERKIKQRVTKERRNWPNQFKNAKKRRHKYLITEQPSKKFLDPDIFL